MHLLAECESPEYPIAVQYQAPLARVVREDIPGSRIVWTVLPGRKGVDE
jgi:hypothetical protein